jgi:hypothetical protein
MIIIIIEITFQNIHQYLTSLHGAVSEQSLTAYIYYVLSENHEHYLGTFERKTSPTTTTIYSHPLLPILYYQRK